jgi:hypothetical protein
MRSFAHSRPSRTVGAYIERQSTTTTPVTVPVPAACSKRRSQMARPEILGKANHTQLQQPTFHEQHENHSNEAQRFVPVHLPGIYVLPWV